MYWRNMKKIVVTVYDMMLWPDIEDTKAALTSVLCTSAQFHSFFFKTTVTNNYQIHVK